MKETIKEKGIELSLHPSMGFNIRGFKNLRKWEVGSDVEYHNEPKVVDINSVMYRIYYTPTVQESWDSKRKVVLVENFETKEVNKYNVSLHYSHGGGCTTSDFECYRTHPPHDSDEYHENLIESTLKRLFEEEMDEFDLNIELDKDLRILKSRLVEMINEILKNNDKNRLNDDLVK